MDITSFIMGYNKGKQSASGGGGNGGSLPAGVYYEVDSLMGPGVADQLHSWFYYNGSLYALIDYVVSNITKATLYKYVDGAWTSLYTNQPYFLAWCKPGPLFVNGKVHFIYSKYHFILDESDTLTTVTSTGVTGANDNFGENSFVWNNELYTTTYISNSVGYELYKWSDETNTWTKVGNLDNDIGGDRFFDVDGSLYVFDGKLYKINTDFTYEVIKSGLQYNSYLVWQRGKWLYSAHASGYNGTIWKINLTTGEQKTLGPFCFTTGFWSKGDMGTKPVCGEDGELSFTITPGKGRRIIIHINESEE